MPSIQNSNLIKFLQPLKGNQKADNSNAQVLNNKQEVKSGEIMNQKNIGDLKDNEMKEVMDFNEIMNDISNEDEIINSSAASFEIDDTSEVGDDFDEEGIDPEDKDDNINDGIENAVEMTPIDSDKSDNAEVMNKLNKEIV